MCRFRPFNEKEMQYSQRPFVKVLEDGKTLLAKNNYDANQPLSFCFDRIFPSETPQSTVYELAAKPIVDSVLKGFNGTVLAYGQTSSGKTYTMIGRDQEDAYYRGIIPRMVSSVFTSIEDSTDDIEYTVKVSYCEIYLERIRDLFDPRKTNLKVLEDRAKGIYIEDITEEYVSQELEIMQLMKLGNNNREVGHTRMNVESSRSHAIFIMTIAQSNLTDYSAKTGKLFLVDLAGSEKIEKTKAKGKRLDEAKKINQSLSMLGLVIKSLTDGKSTHIPYRDSKLTRVLQESLGGNSKTCLIITCSPSPYNEQETLSTLRFGVRAKAIKNKPKINRELTIPELKLLLAQSKDELAEKHSRIQALEKLVIDLGGVLPVIGQSDEPDDYETNNQVTELIEELDMEKTRLAEEIELSRQLKEELATQTAENDRLRSENEDLSNTLMGAKVTLSGIEDRMQDSEDNAQKLQNQVTILQQQITGLTECNAQLETNLSKKEEELETLTATTAVSEKKTHELLNELQELKTRYEEASTAEPPVSHEEQLRQTEALRVEREVNERLTQELEETKTRLLTIDQEKKKESEALKSRVNSLEKNLNSLNLIYQQVNSSNDLSQNEVSNIERRLARKDERIKELFGYLEQAREKIKAYKTKLASLQSVEMRSSLHGKQKILKKIKGGQHPRLAGILAHQQNPLTRSTTS